eukprot:6194612-Pleurochrysis_carterae.AAC.2
MCIGTSNVSTVTSPRRCRLGPPPRVSHSHRARWRRQRQHRKFDTRPPFPGRKSTIFMTESERTGPVRSSWKGRAGGARPAKGPVGSQTSHLPRD